MGFFDALERQSKPSGAKNISASSLALLHDKQCQICPLNRAAGLKHPKMEPVGTDRPLIYILGEAPGATEDKEGVPFVGKAGQVLRFRLPPSYRKSEVRWSNVVRDRPHNNGTNREPTLTEIEACRMKTVLDVEQTKPQAIFGFGNVPLYWATGLTSGISNWAGRRTPIKVGEHVCWYYPFVHPSSVMRDRKWEPEKQSDYGGSDSELAFTYHLKRAFDEVERGLPTPVVHSADDALEGLSFVNGSGHSNDLRRVLSWMRRLDDPEVICGFDVETHGLRPYHADTRILTVALASDEGSFAFPLDHPRDFWSEAERTELLAAFKDFLYNARCRKVVHQLPFEQEWIAFFFGNESLRAQRWGDTIGQAYVLDERQGCLSLDFLCHQHFGVKIKEIDKVDRKHMIDEPLDIVLRYNALDSKYHRLLYLVQKDRLAEEGLTAVYAHQLRRAPTVVLTQLKGIPIDQDRVIELEIKLSKQLEDVQYEIQHMPEVKEYHNKTGKQLNPASNPELLKLLHGIGIHVPNTNEESLEAHAGHPFIDALLEFRAVSKQLSTYVTPCREGSPSLHNGEIHPILSLTKVRTWRTSSEDPNSQNFPKHEAKGGRVNRSSVKPKEIRAMIRPKEPDLRVVSFDYAGIQARNVSMESGDKVLIQHWWDRYDIHTDWLERLVKKYPQFVDGSVKALTDKDTKKAYRNRVKNEFVFASFFGAKPGSVAGYLGVPEKIGEALQEEFWDEFRDVLDWHKKVRRFYNGNGYVTGLSGFRRRAPITQNQLINSPIQADESIIVLTAMSELSEYEEPRFQANMEIHDDLTFIWPKKDIDRNAEVVIDHMLRSPYDWVHVVPIGVEMSIGEDWSNQKPREPVAEFFSDKWTGSF